MWKLSFMPIYRNSWTFQKFMMLAVHSPNRLVFLALLFTSCLLFYVIHRNLHDRSIFLFATKQEPVNEESDQRFENTNYILDWTLFFHKPLSADHLHSCPELNCKLTTDRSLIKESSALIYHLADVNWLDLPSYRWYLNRFTNLKSRGTVSRKVYRWTMLLCIFDIFHNARQWKDNIN